MEPIRKPTRAQLAAFIPDQQALLAFERLFDLDGLLPGDIVYAGVMAATVTLTIASPCVVTWTAHGRSSGDMVAFSTTGTLPTGVVAGTVYFVKKIDANTFNLSATFGGANINTSGAQGGTQTGFVASRPGALLANGAAYSRTLYADLFAMMGTAFGVGDGTTTFNIPSVATVSGCHAFVIF